MTWREIQQSAVDNIWCPYCGAEPGQFCVTSSDARATWPHARRTQPIQSAWSSGYMEGEQDVLDQALDSPDWFARRIERHRQSRETAVTDRG